MLAKPDLIAIGEIIKAQGIRGEVKVIPLTDNPKRFAEIKRIFFQDASGYKELIIEGQRRLNEFVLLKFQGISDLTAAEQLGRGLIYIPREERPTLPKGRYYLDQIEGLSVYTVKGELLGKVVKIWRTGSNDVYAVSDSRREILIPALRDVIKNIDLPAQKMLVELPAGLLEDED